jgi:hypothetical protein
MDNKDNSEKPADSLPKQKQLTKDELISSVREWIKIDTEISKLKADVKGKINKQKQLTDSLVQVMKHNSIDCFDIAGGALVYKQKKSKKTISGKFLLAQLENYYKDSPDTAKDTAKDITKHILSNREPVIKEEIIRKLEK